MALDEFSFDAGPLFDQTPLAREKGYRTEILGPLFYNQKRDTEKTWAFPPFFSHDADPGVESREENFLYPVLSYDRYGKEYRWQFFQLFSFGGGDTQDELPKKQFTIFPIYFQQRSPLTNLNYTAVFPFYGHLKNRLFRDEIFFVMFPIFGESRKKDVVTDNYLYPFFHLRHGDGLSGWQLWPVVGAERKDVTTKTNGFGDVETIDGHDNLFVLWPFFLKHTDGIGTDNEQKFWALIPFYDQLRSPKRDSTTVLWPFFTWIDDREKKYHEWQGPYPFVVIARGEGKTATRFFPLFQQAHNDVYQDNFYVWPIYKYKGIHSDPFDSRHTRIFFYLFQNVTEKNTQTGKEKQRVDLWPFFVYHRDFNSDSRLQILALVETAIANNRGIERNWSPLWSVWRSEKSPSRHTSSQSLLWNLYRHDVRQDVRNNSLLFGLFQYHSDAETQQLRLFYISVFKHKQMKQPSK
jgi:hypothetical protein